MSDEPGGEVVVYRREDGTPTIEVRFDGETVWLTQQQLVDLFRTTRENVTMHLRNIFAEGELDPVATSKAFLQVRQEGTRAVHEQARRKAETEYARYRERLDADPSEVERAYLASIKRTQRKIDGSPS